MRASLRQLAASQQRSASRCSDRRLTITLPRRRVLSLAAGAVGLRVTPAMAAGVTDRVWDMNDVASLIAAQEAPIAKRGPYKKKAA